MAQPIEGYFFYEVHGCVHAKNLAGKSYEKNMDFTYGAADPPGELGGYGLSGKELNVELPAAIAFHASLFPAKTPYQPEAGFYPFSEMGMMKFFGDGTVRAYSRWNISGHFPDYHKDDGSMGYHLFLGHYVFDIDQIVSLPGPVTIGTTFFEVSPFTGLITLNLYKQPPPLVWDYAFTFVNENEARLMAAGRNPRPAVLTGRMWRRSGV